MQPIDSPQDPTAGPAVYRVAFDVPLRRVFDYSPALAPSLGPIEPGTRVQAPFGRKRAIGIVVGTATTSDVPAERLKPLGSALDPEPIFEAPLLALLRWAADYYHHPLGEVLASALPKLLRTVRRKPLPLRRAAADETPDSLASEPGPLVQPDKRLALSDEQQAAVDAIGAALATYRTFLLHGATGSGKTEVYLRLAERALESGKRALILIPEIGLTPQLVGRFRDRFNARVAVLHSALTDTERLHAWREAFSGRARIVLGTRSAVFAPVPDLGLIVVDEEHDASFKQHEGGFRYSARDIAIVRAQRLGIPIVLGSATPALETLHNALTGRSTRLILPRRSTQAPAPRASLIDMRTSAVRAGLSTPVVQSIEHHLGAGRQVLVFLNRRGYAPTLLCTSCGFIETCGNCDARMTVHQNARKLRCHHCGSEAPLPESCTACGFPVKSVGQGTQRIEETLAALFPDAPLVRLDRDAIHRRGDMETAVRRITSGEARLLVGTQMVTKGHDFPDVALVVVLNADQGLFSADFRASERLAQTIIQVAGRAGRAARQGEVLIQTEFPSHPLLKSLITEGYDGFARVALAERAQAHWPPYQRLAALRASATSLEASIEFLTGARSRAPGSRAVKLLGPVPAAMAKRAGRHRAQVLIESSDRGALHHFLDAWLPSLEDLPAARRVHWALDVDPIELF